MDTVRRDENGKINYEPSGENIISICPMCGNDVEIVEWEAKSVEINEFVTIVGGYCGECSSIINEKLLDIEIVEG
jgi:hypothetical protein